MRMNINIDIDIIKEFINTNESSMKYIVYRLSLLYHIDEKRHYIYLFTYPISELKRIENIIDDGLFDLLHNDCLTSDDILLSITYD